MDIAFTFLCLKMCHWNSNLMTITMLYAPICGQLCIYIWTALHIKHLFNIEKTNFREWSDRMQTSTPSLPHSCWPRAIDLLLMVLVLKRDIVVASRCPRTKSFVPKSYFNKLNKINNQAYRRDTCNLPGALELVGVPIYVPESKPSYADTQEQNVPFNKSQRKRTLLYDFKIFFLIWGLWES